MSSVESVHKFQCSDLQSCVQGQALDERIVSLTPVVGWYSSCVYIPRVNFTLNRYLISFINKRIKDEQTGFLIWGAPFATESELDFQTKLYELLARYKTLQY